MRQTRLDHSKVLEAHSSTLAEHGKLLRAPVVGQVAIMEHLGITPPG
ncbi:hypothetical protein ACH4UM_06920 [Streptomyces sp. NPDC020801]